MRKPLLFIIIFCFMAFSSLVGQQQKAEEKPDPMKNFSLVTETKPVNENVKVGFESITGQDAVTYLKFISSDLLEGRETASEGYDIAAQYAASLFELWGIKPAGDPERPRMSMRGMFQPPQKPSTPKRSYLQNIPFIETLGSEGMAAVEFQKGQLKKTKTFNQDMDYSYSASETQSLTEKTILNLPSTKANSKKNIIPSVDA
jgi:hypothetical protein